MTDPTLERASRLLATDPRQAERLATELLARSPGDPRARLVLGAARRRGGDAAGARVVLEPLAAAQTGSPFAQLEFGLCLADIGEPAPAVAALRRALALRENLPQAWRALAEQLVLLGREDEAEALLARRLHGEGTDRARTWLAYGHVLKATGRGVADAYRRAIAAEPDLGEAYWSLANLKSAPFSSAEEAQIVSLLGRSDLPAHHRAPLRYALGKALEDRGQAAAAFEQYSLGAALRHAELAYDAEAASEAMRRAKALFTSAFLAERGGGSASEAPVFIVGLPRSGSTLVEQILASHSQVEGTGELPDIIAIAEGLAARGPYPEVLASLAADEFAALGEAYLERTTARRRLGRPRFIDKMPNNFHHIGLIRLILPRARIIDVRRHPMAAGFSAFRQLFARGHAWSYDLADIGRYYRDYVELMAHFDEVLPGRVRRVIHEDLVADAEGEVRRLLDWCGLAFEPACLKFWETRRAVRTASAEQVRRPIDPGSVDQWRAYQPWLAPLKAALEPALESWRR
jgi:tetratricopeptide (TPR) repeat protein